MLSAGLESAVAHPAHPLDQRFAAAFFGGLTLYLLACVAFGYVTTKTLNTPRLVVGSVVAMLIPFGTTIPAWASLVLATAMLAMLMVAKRIVAVTR